MVKTYRIEAESASFTIEIPYETKSVEFRNHGWENVFIDFLKGSDELRLEGNKTLLLDLQTKKFVIRFVDKTNEIEVDFRNFFPPWTQIKWVYDSETNDFICTNEEMTWE